MMSHCIALHRSLYQGSRALFEAWIALLSVMPTLFVDFSPVGIAPSWGLMKVQVAPESSMACHFVKLLIFLGFMVILSFHSASQSFSSGDGTSSSVPSATIFSILTVLPAWRLGQFIFEVGIKFCSRVHEISYFPNWTYRCYGILLLSSTSLPWFGIFIQVRVHLISPPPDTG